MKKKIIAFVFGAAICGSTAFAQESGFGAKLGLNVASTNAAAEDGITYSSRIGAVVGGYYKYMISDKFGLQPELVFSMQGQNAKFSGFDEDIKFHLNYINIPVMAQYYISEAFWLEGGIQLGLLMGATRTTNLTANPNGSISSEESTDTEGLNGTDFGLGFGLGYQLENGLNFGLRYNLGVTDIESEVEDGETGASNRVLQITVGYQFGL